MPEFAGKISGLALNVPVPDGSTVDLVVETTKPTTIEAINAAVRAATEDGFNGIIEYSSDPIVSSDIIGAPASGVFDSMATMTIADTMVKVIVWFDNGWGYTARVVETLEKMAEGGAE